MGRTSRKLVETACELSGFKLIRHEISGNQKQRKYCYSITDCNGNFLIRNQELSWAQMAIHTHLHNTRHLGMTPWVCKKCKQINCYQTCLECHQPK